MEPQDFQDIFIDTKTAVADLIRSAVPAETRISERETFNDNQDIWLGSLKDSTGKVNCWSVTYAGTFPLDSEAIGADTMVIQFQISAFYKFDFGTDLENSSEIFERILANVRHAFLNNRTLNCDWISEHQGFFDRQMIAKIDTQNVHIASAVLNVVLLPIPFDFN